MAKLDIKKVNSSSKDFKSLVQKLDAELAVMDGDLHDFYHQYNGIEDIKYILVLYENEEAVACGAIKHFDENTMEVKRMYVLESKRGRGYASRILASLECWAKELGYNSCILETGAEQKAAIRLYRYKSYERIENYGQYKGVSNSRCFKKHIK